MSRPPRASRTAAVLSLPLLLAACGGTSAPSAAEESAAPSPLFSTLALPSSGQTYAVLNMCSGKGLDVQNASTANGASVMQWDYQGGTNQQWTLQATDSGYFKLVARHSGKALEVYGWATANGSRVGQWGYGGGTNQQWKLEDVGNGFYELIPRHAANMRLDVRGASLSNGAQVQIYSDNNTCAQRWKLQPTTQTSAPPPTSTPAPTPVRIMPLGDSITDGYNIPGGYRTGLFQKLSAAGLPFDFVGSLLNGPAALPDRDHEGHSGWRIDEIAAQVNTWLDQQQPATTLLMIGTNDIIQNRDPANAPKRLGALLDQMSARRPNMLILVATLPPLAEAGQNRWVGQYNAALPEVVRSRAAQGQKVTLVDVNAALNVADLADGVHPNSTGYSKLANVWYQALRSTPGALSP
ncbi:RICIN domain-containing protein [Deinococcus metallilatus]|nr:RICIN domain-containing protein [Deinococcus metallilatus]MBB5295500.1 lysophospholipase L1-like esterase [Deinococcus metallilatus]GMA16178.1 hypothetical protein GCM10025871_25090 [Deinococcus metallilatus]